MFTYNIGFSFLWSNLFPFVPAALILHCVTAFGFKKWLGPVGTFYGSLMTLSFVLFTSAINLQSVLMFGNYMFSDFGRWFFCLDLVDSHLVYCSDGLALVCAMLVVTLTAFALYFGVEYMSRDPFINRLLYLLNMFATSVTFLFFCGDLFLIMFFWECIGLFSLLLVNFYSTRVYTMKAALKTFVFSRISDMFLFLAFMLAVVVLNTTDLSIMFLQAPIISFHYMGSGLLTSHFLTVFTYCIVVSGTIKSAQFLAHVWLPDAMEAPTPASALIHSSTLVIAGVFLVIRFAVFFEFTTSVNLFLALLGGITLAFSSVTAVFQNDIKKLVAYSTISQIGYLVCGCGFLCYEEVLLYLSTHALNKAFLFVLVGYIVHFFAGNTDMRQMGGLFPYSFDISALFFGVCFNLSGLPFSAGFLGKEFLLYHVLRNDISATYIRGCWLVSFFFTPIYMFILIHVVLFGPRKGNLASYSSYWTFLFTKNNQLTVNSAEKSTLYQVQKPYTPTLVSNNAALVMVPGFQFTSVTSRLTTLVLCTFWVSFFCFGETFMLILFNYQTLTDLIPSSFFTNTKTHSVFQTPWVASTKLSDLVMVLIIFFTTCSFIYLSTLSHFANYKYLTTVLISEVVLLLTTIFLFYQMHTLLLVQAVSLLFCLKATTTYR